MEDYRVKKINEIKQTSITVHVPGSKSITNRALLLAALAKGESALSGVLFSDDSRHFLDCVQKLGIETKVEEDNCNVTVNGHGGAVPAKDAAWLALIVALSLFAYREKKFRLFFKRRRYVRNGHAAAILSVIDGITAETALMASLAAGAKVCVSRIFMSSIALPKMESGKACRTDRDSCNC